MNNKGHEKKDMIDTTQIGIKRPDFDFVGTKPNPIFRGDFWVCPVCGSVNKYPRNNRFYSCQWCYYKYDKEGKW